MLSRHPSVFDVVIVLWGYRYCLYVADMAVVLRVGVGYVKAGLRESESKRERESESGGKRLVEAEVLLS